MLSSRSTFRPCEPPVHSLRIPILIFGLFVGWFVCLFLFIYLFTIHLLLYHYYFIILFYFILSIYLFIYLFLLIFILLSLLLLLLLFFFFGLDPQPPFPTAVFCHPKHVQHASSIHLHAIVQQPPEMVVCLDMYTT